MESVRSMDDARRLRQPLPLMTKSIIDSIFQVDG
jgi:hypothetical protein